jgi:hypothetical protein
LDDFEAAEFLGIPVQQVRKLAEDGTLKLFQDGRVFDVEDLQAFLLSKAFTAAEERAVLLRRARFEARDLENYPDQLRLEVIDDFIATWERFANSSRRAPIQRRGRCRSSDFGASSQETR